jgi:hypothetical protein
VIRRHFIRLASLSAGALPFMDFQGFAATPALEALGIDRSLQGETSGSDLYQIFRQPPIQYRPMVRWWWNGDRVVGEEILRELNVMQAAGIGGVEINPIRFPADADPMKTTALTWMSDEWVKVLQVALEGTKERGMTCDMIVGSGWPYGGEFLTREDQTQMVALGTQNFTGPGHVRLARADLLNLVNPSLVSSYKEGEKELFSLTLVPSQLSATSAAVPLDAQLRHNEIEFDLPAGDHVLYVLVKLTGYMAVINGAPGATGPVLNHYSQPAVARYLDRLSSRLSAKIGPLSEHFRAFFTDSIELEGANWCDDMFAEFQRRRKYDLSPWLPFVLFKVGEMGNAVTEQYGAKFSAEFKAQTEMVRYDFETTKHELFQERFIGTFVQWCRRNGVQSRMQAYGMDCDGISAGMMLDIPECETWIRSEAIEPFGTGDYRQGRSYTMINKFVSSAAHLSGKQLISCEEMTNTDDPFHASLDRIKVAGDQSMLSGVTQSVLHGFNYSPPEAPFPGWVRYGTYFSERNTWWPYFKLWADYKARLSALFQHCVMQADIAILPPFADLASEFGFQRDPFPKTVKPTYLYKLWEVIHQNGSGCDYLNEEIVAQSLVKQGRLTFRDRSYRGICLPEIESIRPATAKVLQALVESGGTLILIGRVPDRAPGLLHHEPESRLVKQLFEETRQKYPSRAPLVQMREEEMVNWYRDIQQRYSLSPAVSISEPTDFVSQLHYVGEKKEFYFFTNYSPSETHTFDAAFHLAEGIPLLWDPETGERQPYPAASHDRKLSITLGPSESKLIAFESPDEINGPDLSQERQIVLPGQPSDHHLELAIKGPWTIEFLHVDGTKQSRIVQDPGKASLQEEERGFAGTILYKAHFTVDHPDQHLVLDLGHLHGVSELELNGRQLGTRWYGVHTYNLSGSARQGENELTIKVVTTLGNYMKTLTGNTAARNWTEHTPTYPIGLTNPIRLTVQMPSPSC